MYRLTNDVAKDLQATFQDPATTWFEGIIDLHSYIMLYIVFLLFAVLWFLSSIILQSLSSSSLGRSFSNKFTYKYHVEGRLLEFLWTLFPAVILIFIAIPSFKLLYWMDEVIDPVLTIKVIGKQWYWDCEFSDIVGYSSYMVPTEELEKGQYRLLEVDNRIVLPINKKIRVIVTSGDVIHSWAVPSLGIKTDAIPGRLNQTSMSLNREGVFYGQCSELCGVGHAFMPIVVQGVKLEDYILWLESQS